MKVIVRDNYRVEVSLKDPYVFTKWESNTDKVHKLNIGICEDIVNDIKRHIDNVGYVSVAFDEHETCEHCGYSWEEEEDGTPMCCSKAVLEFMQSKQQ